MTEKKHNVNIPVQGSLGLLALGHTGLIAWRKAREAAKLKEQQSNDTHKK